MSQNGPQSELSSTFKEEMIDESKFPASTPVLNTKYKHFRSWNNNPFYFFNDQIDYKLAHYFADSEITKRNIDKLLTNPLMEFIIKSFLYRNADE